MLRLLLSRPAMLLWGVLLANWLSEERTRTRRPLPPPRRRAARPTAHPADVPAPPDP